MKDFITWKETVGKSDELKIREPTVPANEAYDENNYRVINSFTELSKDEFYNIKQIFKEQVEIE